MPDQPEVLIMFDIQVHVHGDNSEEARLTTAVHLVKRLGGRLCCIQVSPEPRLISVDALGGTYFTPQLADMQADMDQRNHERIDTWLGSHGVHANWRHEFGDPGAVLARASRLADLVIVSAGPMLLRGHDQPLSVAAKSLSRSRVPTLVLPEGKDFAPGGPVMIAWDGSDEAFAALRGAVPLLALSNQVHVVAIGSKAQTSLDEATAYLRDRLVDPIVERLDKSAGSLTSATLRKTAAKLGVGLLVMGAFGDGRAREFIFGGVTEAFLEDMSIPLLLCH